MFSKVNPFGPTNKGKDKENKKILLIDEADIFFDPEFFGNLYCPAVSLKCT